MLEEAVAERVERAVSYKTHNHSFMLRTFNEDGVFAVDWRWPDARDASWGQSSMVSSVRWSDAVTLDEEGRSLILKSFGLTEIEHEYPLELLVKLPPRHLMAARREYEELHGYDRLEVLSDRCGDHIDASKVQ